MRGRKKECEEEMRSLLAVRIGEPQASYLYAGRTAAASASIKDHTEQLLPQHESVAVGVLRGEAVVICTERRPNVKQAPLQRTLRHKAAPPAVSIDELTLRAASARLSRW